MFKIPFSERIPNLIKHYTELYKSEGEVMIGGLLVGMISKSFEMINLTRQPTIDQIGIISDMIIEQSNEDWLSIQDVALFLEKLVKGETQSYYQTMDVPTFFRLFEEYREARFKAMQSIRYEQHANHRSAGNSDRVSDDKNAEIATLKTAMKQYNFDQELKRQNATRESD